MGEVAVELDPPELGFADRDRRRSRVTECQMVNQFAGLARPSRPSSPAATGWSSAMRERKAMAMALVDRALRAGELGEDADCAGAGPGIRALPLRQCRGDRLRRAPEAAALCRFPGRAGDRSAELRRRRPCGERRGMTGCHAGYNFAYLDEQTKRMIRRAILKAVAIPGYQVPFGSARDAAALWLGHRRHPGHGRDHRPGRRAQGHRPGRRRHHQRRLDPRASSPGRPGCATTDAHRGGHASSRPATASPRRRCARARSWSTRCRSRSRCAGSSRARPRRASMHALADYGLMHVRLYEDIARHGHVATTYDYPVMVNGRYLMAPSPIPELRQPEDAPHRRRCSCSAPGARSGSTPCRPTPPVRSLDFEDHPVRRSSAGPALRALRRRRQLSRRGGDRRPRRADVRLLRHRLLREPRQAQRRRPARMSRAARCWSVARPHPALRRRRRAARRCRLRPLAGRGRSPSSASPARARPRCCACSPACWRRTPARCSTATRHGATAIVLGLAEAARRRLLRTDWGFVHQNPRDGLRLGVTAGGNIGERLMAVGARHYGAIRAAALDWLARVEIDAGRIDDLPRDLLRRHAAAAADRPQPGHAAAAGLHGRADRRARRLGAGAAARPDPRPGRRLGLAAVIVTHDLAVARLLAHRMLVMRRRPGGRDRA